MTVLRHLGPLLCTAPLLLACGGPSFTAPQTLGGVTIAPEVLNRGQDLFNRFCATCHGSDGKADTPQARQLEPHPRDFTTGIFQRTAHPDALPSDAELARIITHGLPGTGMPGWPNLEGDDLTAVVHYLKTFSPRWRTP